MTDDTPKEIKKYFKALTEECKICYAIAEKAREKGYDPEDRIEIPPAEDVASRVEELIGPPGVRDRINKLKKKGLDTEEIAFKITKEIVKGKFIETDRSDLAKLAIRAGLCILTAGITAAPIEGLVDVRIQKNKDGSNYISMYFSGPIRAAGGTAAAQAVVLGDFVRDLMDIDRYKPSKDEIERYLEEIKLYKRIRNLQFPVKPKLIRKTAKNIPVEVTGEPTEKEEVTGYRNIWRIRTNKIRGGACLVLNDGIIGKSHKLMKIVERFEFKGWNWLSDLQQKNRVEDNEDEEKIKPVDKFIAGVIAGRPILSHPSKKEGFRIRYGRVRNTGLAAVGLNIFTMKITGNFLVQGTQFITERPGKGSISMGVDWIEGPIVKLYNGSVVKIENNKDYNNYKDKIKRILYLGDVLIGFGEFLENNHILVPSGYTEEWWGEECRKLIESKYNEVSNFSEDCKINNDRIKSLFDNPFDVYPLETEVLELSKLLDLPIHPRYTPFWEYVSEQDVRKIRKWFISGKFVENNAEIASENESILEIPLENHTLEKSIIERLGIEHKVEDNKVIIKKNSLILKELLKLDQPELELEISLPNRKNNFMGKFFEYKIRAKAPYRMGGRM
ncbi:MAG: DNA polymerase II large subunit, partial [Candidatus Lokiarchaeota archaeon]|nr:DNA polymerase II large subunit [Candidatus Lokiarchaeota archaeon]